MAAKTKPHHAGIKAQYRPHTASPMQSELDLDCPPISLTFPSPASLEGRLLDVLLREGRTDVDSFYNMTGSHEVRRAVSALRDRLWPIHTLQKSAPTHIDPERVIGDYVLSRTDIEITGGQYGQR